MRTEEQKARKRATDAERRKDPAWRARKNSKERERFRKSPEVRRKRAEYGRKWEMANPEKVRLKNVRRKEAKYRWHLNRLSVDPDYRAHINRLSRESGARQRLRDPHKFRLRSKSAKQVANRRRRFRERYHTDPNFRQKRLDAAAKIPRIRRLEANRKYKEKAKTPVYQLSKLAKQLAMLEEDCQTLPAFAVSSHGQNTQEQAHG